MWNLINAPETEIFGIAIALMVLLGVLEVISMLAGGISDWLDNLLPDSLTETAHAEVGLDVADAGIFVRFLSWLYVGRIPVLMLMVVFLAVYGLTGYLFQTALINQAAARIQNRFKCISVQRHQQYRIALFQYIIRVRLYHHIMLLAVSIFHAHLCRAAYPSFAQHHCADASDQTFLRNSSGFIFRHNFVQTASRHPY